MMEKSQNFMTIKAFAEAAGRSQQTIYKQIGTRLAPYLHEIEGQKYIERRALAEVFKIGETGEVQPEQPRFNSTDNNDEQPLLAVLEATIETLRQQLEQKDAQLAAKDQQIHDLTDIIKTQAQSINAANHKELAGTMKQLLPEEPVTEVHEESVEASSVVMAPDPAPAEPERKTFRGWIRSIFR